MIAKVCFYGINGSTAKKDYYFITDIRDLKVGELVIVESRDSYATGTFVGYCNTSYAPTKSIIERVNKKQATPNKRTKNKKIKLLKSTEQLVNEIMEFHKQNYIDRCLEQNNYSAIEDFLNKIQ